MAAAAAVTATVALSLAAASLLSSSRHPGSPAGPSADPNLAASPSSALSGSLAAGSPSSAAATASPLAQVVAGTGPPPSGGVLVGGGGSGYRLVDLGTGLLGPLIVPDDWRNELFRLATGGLLCVCIERESSVRGHTWKVAARIFDAGGTELRRFGVGTFTGSEDKTLPFRDQGDSIRLSATLSPDDRTLFIGHGERQPPQWRLGVTVVDMLGGRVSQVLRLDSVPSNTGSLAARASISPVPTPSEGSGMDATAPSVSVAPNGRHVLIRESVWTLGEVALDSIWSADVTAGAVGRLRALPGGTGTLTERVCRGGPATFIDSSTIYSFCSGPPEGLHRALRRIALDGSPLGDVKLEGPMLSGTIAGQLFYPASRSLFLWDPFQRALTKVDLDAGTVVGSVTAPALSEARSGLGDQLAGLGHSLAEWIAPSVLAKYWLQPALVPSTDGTRIYALGLSGSGPEEPGQGSAGIFVFDAATLQFLAHWPAIADYMSIAVSVDGRFVYATGAPGADAAGNETRWQASLTVHDAESGAVTTTLGQLGRDPILLMPER